MSASPEVKTVYDNGVAKGTAQGRLLGRLEAYQDMERYLTSILPQIPRYESPKYTQQALVHCQSRIMTLNRSPVVAAASTQDNVSKIKEIADELKERRHGSQQH